MQDLKALGVQVGSPIIPPDHPTMTLERAARELPLVYAEPSSGANPEEDRNARQEWLLLRVRWIIDIWFQVWMKLMCHLPSAVPSPPLPWAPPPLDPEAQRYHRPGEMRQVIALWHMIKELTLEYIRAKADLLRQLDSSIPHVTVNRGVNAERLFAEATNAYWEYRPGAHLLLLQALRYAVVEALGLRDAEHPPELRAFATSQLLVLANGAGLTLPFSLDLLGNITFDLESAVGRCQEPSLSYSFPVFQLLSAVIEEFLAAEKNPAIHERAIEIFKE